MSFEDDLKAELDRVKPTADVDVRLKGTLYTFRFEQMDGLEWADATDRFPARPGVLLDARYGYNLRPLSLLVASKTGARVDGDALVKLSEDQWRTLFKALPGAPVMRIGDVIFALNEYTPGEEVEALKKGSAVAPALNSD